MLFISFRGIAAFILCLILVSAQNPFLVEKTSRTQDDHVVQEFANLRGVNATSKHGDVTAVTTASLSKIGRVPIDQSGRILTYGLEQFIVTVAGIGSGGFSGDNGAATSAQISDVEGLNVDGKGDIYLADTYNNRIRKVTVSTGIITTIADTKGVGAYNGDNITATSAQLYYPCGVAVDALGDVYIADTNNNRIRKVTVSTGIITTIAGTRIGAAKSAYLNFPVSVALDGMGNVYIADTFNQRIKKVNVSTGSITTIAGTGTRGYFGDNGAATSAQLKYPQGVAIDGSGNVYIGDSENNRIRKVTVSTGIITTIAGTGTAGYNGDNRAATSANISYPNGLTLDKMGNVYIVNNEIIVSGY